MTKRNALEQRINRHLAYLISLAKIENANGRTDINKSFEDLFCELINLVYKTANFTNANKIAENYPAVDLVDVKRGVCMQITTSLTKKKYDDTIEKHLKFGLHKKYPLLMFMVVDYKSYNPIKKKNKAVYCLIGKIINILTLSKDISKLSSEKLMQIDRYLSENINFPLITTESV